MKQNRNSATRRLRLPNALAAVGMAAAALVARPARADSFAQLLRDAIRERSGEPTTSTLVPIVDNTRPADAKPADGKPGDKPMEGDENVDLTGLSVEQLMAQEVVPINVLGGHTHPAGQYMVGYRFMSMRQSGELDGTHEIGVNHVLREYVNAPTSMDMEMHMAEAMYAPTDDLTVMLMLPFKRMWMEKATLIPGGGHGGHGGHSPDFTAQPLGGSTTPQDHGFFSERSAGWGDLTAMALYTFKGDVRQRGDRWLLNAGMSFPTGSIDQTHDGVHRHEYAMQLCSGTFDLLPGVTYLGDKGNWSFGAQALGTLRLGRNYIGYRLGNELDLNAWTTYRVTDWFAPSVRLEHRLSGRIAGSDPTLDPLLDSTFDPANYGGSRTDILFGVNLYAPRGRLKGHRLTIEGGFPIYQSLNGPQLANDWQLTVAWSYSH